MNCDDHGNWREATHTLCDLLVEEIGDVDREITLDHPGAVDLGDSHDIPVLRFAAICVNRYAIMCVAPRFTIRDLLVLGLDVLVPNSRVVTDFKMTADSSLSTGRIGLSLLARGSKRIDRIHNRLLPNKAKCAKCGVVVQSSHRHDFVSCECGAFSLDGGNDYWRVVGDIGSVVRLDWDGKETCGESTKHEI